MIVMNDDMFVRSPVDCPVCGCRTAAVTFMIAEVPDSGTTCDVIDFACSFGCWRPWGPNNDLIAEAFRYTVTQPRS